jgi:membrane protein
VHLLKQAYRVALEAFRRFNADDGWAIASHIALSALMALFPFLLILTAIAGFIGSRNLADEAARIILETWPEQVSATLALEVHSVVESARGGGVLTIGALLALFFASAGVEALRIALNRAYDIVDVRPWWLTRLESIGYIIIAAFGMLALSFLVFLAPLIWATIIKYFPQLEPFGYVITFVRFAVATLVLVVALLVVHMWLPAGRRRLRDIMPGVIATLALWLIVGTVFGRYLADFAFTYSRYYAGLASPMIAIVFLYFTSSVFIYGGDLNAVIRDFREARARKQKTPPKTN